MIFYFVDGEIGVFHSAELLCQVIAELNPKIIYFFAELTEAKV